MILGVSRVRKAWPFGSKVLPRVLPGDSADISVRGLFSWGQQKVLSKGLLARRKHLGFLEACACGCLLEVVCPSCRFCGVLGSFLTGIERDFEVQLNVSGFCCNFESLSGFWKRVTEKPLSDRFSCRVPGACIPYALGPVFAAVLLNILYIFPFVYRRQQIREVLGPCILLLYISLWEALNLVAGTTACVEGP